MGKPTAYGKIIEYLTETIEQNCDNPDFILPSEVSLALKFNVSRKPVRDAYLNLINRGYIKSRQGKGYFIAKPMDVKPATAFKNICFITPSIKIGFMRQIIKGMQDFCDKQRLNLLIMESSGDAKKEKRLLQSFQLSNTKGAIIFPIDNEFYNEELLALSLKKFPIVIIDRYLKGVNFAYVATDNYRAMSDVVQFLHQKNFTRIVYITPPPSIATSIEERINGFNHGLFKYYGVASATNMLKIKPDDLAAQKKSLIDYLKNFPDTEAVIVTRDQAIAAISAAAELNIPIPEKLRLIILDSELSDAEKAAVQPYIVEQDGYGIGYEATAALYNQIYGDLRIITKKLPIKIIDCSALDSSVSSPLKPQTADNRDVLK